MFPGAVSRQAESSLKTVREPFKKYARRAVKLYQQLLTHQVQQGSLPTRLYSNPTPYPIFALIDKLMVSSFVTCCAVMAAGSASLVILLSESLPRCHT